MDIFATVHKDEARKILDHAISLRNQKVKPEETEKIPDHILEMLTSKPYAAVSTFSIKLRSETTH